MLDRKKVKKEKNRIEEKRLTRVYFTPNIIYMGFPGIKDKKRALTGTEH